MAGPLAPLKVYHLYLISVQPGWLVTIFHSVLPDRFYYLKIVHNLYLTLEEY
ncbi:hypothetical protein I79_015591 [Cricetulus griseus]|uniref:Uncharacterized protein n=1 Tax=Cricetulus griseus TaxID=10029 RepID=G3HX72_CRIGR|nr:hypothetical protein I79_015591 [Cricetulus griseus]